MPFLFFCMICSHVHTCYSYMCIYIYIIYLFNSYLDVCFIILIVDEDSNGAIDYEELKKSFHKLEISCTEEEINDLFQACDINEDKGIDFNEFIVLLCLVYLLKDDAATLHAVSWNLLSVQFLLSFLLHDSWNMKPINNRCLADKSLISSIIWRRVSYFICLLPSALLYFLQL